MEPSQRGADAEAEQQQFTEQLGQTAGWFIGLKNSHRNEALDHIIEICEPQQLYMLAAKLSILLKRDFIKRLPPELSYEILKFMTPEELGKCCVISKSWNDIINTNTPLWRNICVNSGVQVKNDLMYMEALFYKSLYIHAKRRIKNIGQQLECMSLTGHSERITALSYHDGKVASGKFIFISSYTDFQNITLLQLGVKRFSRYIIYVHVYNRNIINLNISHC